MTNTRSILRCERFLLALLALCTILFSPAPASAEILFTEGFESGVGAWKQDIETEGGSVVLETTGSKVRSGSKAARFVCNGCRRVELSGAPHSKFDWNKEYWLGYSFLVAKLPGGFRIMNQHHSTPHGRNWSCPAGGNSFTIKGASGKLTVFTSTDPAFVNVVRTEGGATAGNESFDLPFDAAKWQDVVMNFRYAPDSTGFMKVWLNGDLIFDEKGPTVYKLDACGKPKEPVQYLKIGLYLGGASGEIYYDDVRIGDAAASFADVSPGSKQPNQPDDPPVVDPPDDSSGKAPGPLPALDRELLFEDDFGAGDGALPDNYWLESESDVAARIVEGALELDAHVPGSARGGTVFLDRVFTGDIQVEYEVSVIESGEQRNANLFFFLSDPSGKSLRSTRSSRASASYPLYHELAGYVVTHTADAATDLGRVRLRDLPGFDHLLKEENKGKLAAGRTYRVSLTRLGNNLYYSVDGEPLAAVTDDAHNARHAEGLLGFRTFDSRVRWDELRVYRIAARSAPDGGQGGAAGGNGEPPATGGTAGGAGAGGTAGGAGGQGGQASGGPKPSPPSGAGGSRDDAPDPEPGGDDVDGAGGEPGDDEGAAVTVLGCRFGGGDGASPKLGALALLLLLASGRIRRRRSNHQRQSA